MSKHRLKSLWIAFTRHHVRVANRWHWLPMSIPLIFVLLVLLRDALDNTFGSSWSEPAVVRLFAPLHYAALHGFDFYFSNGVIPPKAAAVVWYFSVAIGLSFVIHVIQLLAIQRLLDISALKAKARFQRVSVNTKRCASVARRIWRLHFFTITTSLLLCYLIGFDWLGRTPFLDNPRVATRLYLPIESAIVTAIAALLSACIATASTFSQTHRLRRLSGFCGNCRYPRTSQNGKHLAKSECTPCSECGQSPQMMAEGSLSRQRSSALPHFIWASLLLSLLFTYIWTVIAY
jgi:hypothetical protein